MGCTSSSLRTPAGHRDDLLPQPHPYREGEVRRTSGFTRSTSATGVTKTATATAKATHPHEHQYEHQHESAGAGGPHGKATGEGHFAAMEASHHRPMEKEETTKELREQAKRRMAGRRTEPSGPGIANFAWT